MEVMSTVQQHTHHWCRVVLVLFSHIVMEDFISKVDTISKEVRTAAYDRLPLHLRTPEFARYVCTTWCWWLCRRGPALAAVMGFVVGIAFGGGLMTAVYSENHKGIGLYISVCCDDDSGDWQALGMFHILEYLMTAFYNKNTLSADCKHNRYVVMLQLSWSTSQRNTCWLLWLHSLSLFWNHG